MANFSLPISGGWLAPRPTFIGCPWLLRLLFVSFLLVNAPGVWAQTVFINELTYDSQSLLNGRFQNIVPNLVEIAGPAGTNLTNWSLVLYGRNPRAGNTNQNRGMAYDTARISGRIQNQQNGYGTLAFSLEPATLQPEPGSGIALVNAAGGVVQLVSYGGSLTAVNGPAAGMVAQVIPRVHSATNGIQSLQLRGTGTQYTDFTWSTLSTYSPGRINALVPASPQVFAQPTSVNLSVNVNTVTEGGSTSSVIATVTASAPVVGNQSVRIRGSGTNVTGDDFSIRDATVTLLSGATSGSTVVTIRDDAVVEGTDTLRLIIDAPSSAIVLGTVTTQTVVILDNDAPPGRFTLTQPTYDCRTGVITFNTSGGDGSPITYVAPGIQRNAETDRSGTVEAALRDDPKTLVIRATQSGVTVSYSFDFAGYCAETTETPPLVAPDETICGSPANTLGQPFTLLPPTYDCATGVIRFNTSGGDGSPIRITAPGITTATTNCVETLDPGNTDNDTYVLTASQNGVTVTLTWTRPCRSLRRAVPEPVSTFSVTVLGNPVVGDVIQFEVRGAAGQRLRTSLINGQGQTVSELEIAQPGAVERQALRVIQPPGLYVLRVSTAGQTATVKVVKQ